VGCYEASFKVSRRSHLFSDFRKASWLREFDTTVKQRILARMRTWLRPACAGPLPDLTIASGEAAGWWRIRLRLVKSTRKKVDFLVTRKVGLRRYWGIA